VNPDVFITIAFAGIVVTAALLSLLFVMRRVRREDLRAQER
jgi:hypothetical protein